MTIEERRLHAYALALTEALVDILEEHGALVSLLLNNGLITQSQMLAAKNALALTERQELTRRVQETLQVRVNAALAAPEPPRTVQ